MWSSVVRVTITFAFVFYGMGAALIDRLMITNWWFRRVPYRINSALFVWMMLQMLRGHRRCSADV